MIKKTSKNQTGFSLIELIIVLLILGIIAVIALPQVTASNRLWRFAGFQREVVSLLREARQEAISQRTTVTFHYDDDKKQIVLYGGHFGVLGDSNNRIYVIPQGTSVGELVYGRVQGSADSALKDGAKLTPLSNKKVEIKFQSDGAVVDGKKNLKNDALFFYVAQNPYETAFGVSVLGAGGRTKVWRYSQSNQNYGE